MNKSELKSLVKECLVEILLEGIGHPSSKIAENRTIKQPSNTRQVTTRPALDLIRHGELSPSINAALPKRPVQNSASYKELANGNDVMASIFADTAASGLVEQLGNPGGQGPQSSNPVIDTGIDPNLFEGASNWATMAFSEKRSARQ